MYTTALQQRAEYAYSSRNCITNFFFVFFIFLFSFGKQQNKNGGRTGGPLARAPPKNKKNMRKENNKFFLLQ